MADDRTLKDRIIEWMNEQTLDQKASITEAATHTLGTMKRLGLIEDFMAEHGTQVLSQFYLHWAHGQRRTVPSRQDPGESRANAPAANQGMRALQTLMMSVQSINGRFKRFADCVVTDWEWLEADRAQDRDEAERMRTWFGRLKVEHKRIEAKLGKKGLTAKQAFGPLGSAVLKWRTEVFGEGA